MTSAAAARRRACSAKHGSPSGQRSAPGHSSLPTLTDRHAASARRPVELGAVAGVGACRPTRRSGGSRRASPAAMPSSSSCAVRSAVHLAQPLQAHVVAAALEHGPVERRPAASTCRNGRSLPASWSCSALVAVATTTRAPDVDGRHEVGERLAGAGAGLHDEVAAAVDRRGDELGHPLPGPAAASAPGSAAVTARERRPSATARSAASRRSHGDEGERGVELGGVELRPGLVGEVDRRPGALPEQEVGDPPLAGRAHEHVDRWQLGQVEVVGDGLGRDLDALGHGRAARRRSAPGGRRSRRPR